MKQLCVFFIYLFALSTMSNTYRDRVTQKGKKHFLWLQYGILILMVLILECVVAGLAFGLKGDVRIHIIIYIPRLNSSFYQ